MIPRLGTAFIVVLAVTFVTGAGFSWPAQEADLSVAEIHAILASPTDRLRQGIDPGSQLKETLEFTSKAHNVIIAIDYRSFNDYAAETPEQVDQKGATTAATRAPAPHRAPRRSQTG